MARTNRETAAPQPAKVSLVAVDPINHDGVDYAPGAPLEVTEEQAEQLLLIGAARRPAEDPAPAPAPQAPAGGAEQVQQPLA